MSETSQSRSATPAAIAGLAPAGVRGVVNDAVAVYVNTPTCAVAFVARWCVPGDPSGFYDLRQDEPARRVPVPFHSTSSGR